MQGTGKNMDGGAEFTPQEGQRGLQISPLMIGMEGAPESLMKL